MKFETRYYVIGVPSKKEYGYRLHRPDVEKYIEMLLDDGTVDCKDEEFIIQVRIVKVQEEKEDDSK